MTVPEKAVVLLSGGLDSMVTAGLAHEQGYALFALTIHYNQRHAKEVEAAKAIAAHLGVARHLVLPVDLSLFGGSALTGGMEVPKQGVEPGIPVTYVPGRNLVFLSLALSWAEAVGAHRIFLGVNALDYSGYPDCRPEFIRSFTETANAATRDGVHGRSFQIQAPLQAWSKSRIVQECSRLGLDPGISWSCYDPAADGLACGLCDSCRLRQKGFREANLVDGTSYVAEP